MIIHYIGQSFKPTQYIPWFENRSNIKNQQDLDEYWKQNVVTPIHFVKYEMKYDQSINTLDRVLVVLDIERNFDKLTFDYRGRPKLFKVVSCSRFSVLPPRWESPQEFISLTPDEYEQLIKPNYDYISNKIKHWSNENNSVSG